MPTLPAALRRRLARPLALALLATGAAACSDSTGPADPLDGRWLAVGELPAVYPTAATIELTLDQAGGTVTGTGSMQYPGAFASELDVQGTVNGSVVMLTLTSAALTGDAMTMQAILAEGGDGFTGPLTLGQASETTRQRTFTR